MDTLRERITITLTTHGRHLLRDLAITHGTSRSVLLEILLREKARSYDRDYPGWQDAATQEKETAS